MAIIKGKIGIIDMFRDTFAENFNRPQDIILRVADGAVPSHIAPVSKALYYGDLKNMVVKIKNAPNTIAQNLQDMNGFHFIEDYLNDTGALHYYTYLYLSTGRTLWKGEYDPIIKGADFEINTAAIAKTKTIAGWRKDKSYIDGKLRESAGKVENCRRIYKWIKDEIAPQAAVLVVETQHTQDFQNIVADLESWNWIAEAAYNQCQGLLNSNNPFIKQTTEDNKQYLQKQADRFRLAAERMLGAEDDFLSKEKRIKDWMKRTAFEKAMQKFKTLTLAPVRGIFLGMIALNVKKLGAALYEAKTQKPKDYENIRSLWYDMGGNRTEFDNTVEKGGKKKNKSFTGSEIYASGQIRNDVFYKSAEGDVKEGDPINFPVGLGSVAAQLYVTIWPSPDPASQAALRTNAAAAGGAVDIVFAAMNKMDLKWSSASNDDPVETNEDAERLAYENDQNNSGVGTGNGGTIENDQNNSGVGTGNGGTINGVKFPHGGGGSPKVEGVSFFAKNKTALIVTGLGLAVAGTLGYVFRNQLFKK